VEAREPLKTKTRVVAIAITMDAGPPPHGLSMPIMSRLKQEVSESSKNIAESVAGFREPC